jgi:hypothetical protein
VGRGQQANLRQGDGLGRVRQAGRSGGGARHGRGQGQAGGAGQQGAAIEEGHGHGFHHLRRSLVYDIHCYGKKFVGQYRELSGLRLHAMQKRPSLPDRRHSERVCHYLIVLKHDFYVHERDFPDFRRLSHAAMQWAS